MSAPPDCREARLLIGAEPHALPPHVAAHVAGCEGCRRFHDETRALDARVRAALEMPLAGFRETADRRTTRWAPRRVAMAASVLLCCALGAALLLVRPAPTLAAEVAEHVVHEAGSWELTEPLSREEILAVLGTAGVEFDTTMPVVYAAPCVFRGHRSPHLVVQTANGPVTVMLLAREKVKERREFDEHGFRGVLLPAGEGSVAVLSRGAAVPDAVERAAVSGVRFR